MAAHSEQRFNNTRATADLQIKGGAGVVHTVSIAPTTASPTAGLLTIYDALTETGTILYSEWVFATTPGHTILLDCVATVGIFVGYTTVTDVSCTVTWR